MADTAIHREPWRPKGPTYILLRCPRCGKEVRVIAGATGACPHFDTRGRPIGVAMQVVLDEPRGEEP